LSQQPVISFVIPAYNEERLLGLTIRAIHDVARSIGEPYEIIVADDASTDRTVAVAAECGARAISVANRQIAATRNAGARQASGTLLMFVDADTIVNEAVVSAALRAMKAGAVGGGASVRFEGRLPRYAMILQPLMEGVLRVGRLAAGCFIFCTRDAFDSVSGFDERLFGAEEIALSRALRRLGPFVILRESVTTSGRKLRTYSGWEVLRLLGRLVLRGRRLVESRDDLDMWYDGRREEPDRNN
jgi:glycosyltransferase involved in cell wall biosynthesis